MNAEQVIRQHPDMYCKFYSVDPETGRILTKKVPHDFIPKYKPVPAPDSSGPHNNAHVWTDEEDETVIALRNQRKRWTEIGKVVGVSATTAINRYNELCRIRGLEPVRNEETRNWTFPPEVRERVISMRMKGHMFKEIAEIVGMTVTQAEHVFIRWRRAQARQGEAA